MDSYQKLKEIFFYKNMLMLVQDHVSIQMLKKN